MIHTENTPPLFGELADFARRIDPQPEPPISEEEKRRIKEGFHAAQFRVTGRVKIEENIVFPHLILDGGSKGTIAISTYGERELDPSWDEARVRCLVRYNEYDGAYKIEEIEEMEEQENE